MSGETTTLTDDRVSRLIEVGFKFSVKKDSESTWTDGFTALLAFKDIQGHCDVPSTYEDITLANWVKRQRKEFKAKNSGQPSSLTDDRINQLEEVGFKWFIGRGRGRR